MNDRVRNVEPCLILLGWSTLSQSFFSDLFSLFYALCSVVLCTWTEIPLFPPLMQLNVSISSFALCSI